MIIKPRHYVNEEIHLVRFFLKEEKENVLSLSDCLLLLKDEIVSLNEIGYDILNFTVTKEIVYTDAQRGYAGQNSIDAAEPIIYVGCNRYPDYFIVEDLNDLLDSSWDIVHMDAIPPIRYIYLESKYVISFLDANIDVFKELKKPLVSEINKRISHKKLAIFN